MTDEEGFLIEMIDQLGGKVDSNRDRVVMTNAQLFDFANRVRWATLQNPERYAAVTTMPVQVP